MCMFTGGWKVKWNFPSWLKARCITHMHIHTCTHIQKPRDECVWQLLSSEIKNSYSNIHSDRAAGKGNMTDQYSGSPRTYIYVCVCLCDSRNRVNHVQSHLHTAVGMVCLGLGQSRHTVVTVPQNLYPPAVILLQTDRDGYLIHQMNISHCREMCSHGKYSQT